MRSGYTYDYRDNEWFAGPPMKITPDISLGVTAMRRNLLGVVVTVAFIGGCGITADARDKVTPDSPAAKFNALVKEFDKAESAYFKRLDSVSGIEAQGKIFREENPQPAFAGRFLEIARNHPKDAAAYASLTWIVQNSEFGAAADKPYAQAVALLADQYAQHPDSEELFEQLAKAPFASAGQYLKAVHEKHPSPATRGRAGFHLGLYLKNYCATVEQLRGQPEMAKNVELFVGPDLFKQLKNTDTAEKLRHADEVFARVKKDSALVLYKRTVLGKAADAELFELRNLAVGKTAPDIEGEDTDGKKFKLSDYRGKVVGVVFWGTWCGHCMAMVPQEKALVKRLEGQPFAILGVNSDADREKLKPVLAKRGITWRSFYDGPNTEGPIASRWNVLGWPAVYVLDTKGVIRFKHVRDEILDRAVDALMKEAKGN